MNMAPSFQANGESQLVAGKEQWKIEAPPHRRKRSSINNILLLWPKTIQTLSTKITLSSRIVLQ
jgi:hypothetical protein